MFAFLNVAALDRMARAVVREGTLAALGTG